MRRRLFCCLLIVLMAASLMMQVTSASAENTLTTGEITGDNVALRKDASYNASRITRMKKGSIVDILKSNVNAEWYQVKFNGKTGYVNRMYVSLEPSLPAYQVECSGTIVNCRKQVNVRKTPSLSASILGVAKKDATYKVTRANASSGWHAVDYNGTTGYISSKYVQLTAIVPQNQLSSMTVTGGTLSPNFAPGEYGYVLRASGSEVTIAASANEGVKIDIDGSGKSSKTFKLPESGSRTVRIKLNGKTRYSVYIVRNALIVGTWNIKRGNDNLVMQGRLVETQQPDIMGLQEVYQSLKAKSKIDNLASLRTKKMSNMAFASTVDYAGGAQYGIGVLSAYEPISTEVFALTSLDREPRVLQKLVFKIDGKKVSFYNTHFSFESASMRSKQFADVIRIMDQDENKYRILVGDFNAQAKEFSKLKGYRVLNSPSTKFYDTDGSSISKKEIDNVIVSKSFTVLNTRMINSRLSDHKPIFAFLRFD